MRARSLAATKAKKSLKKKVKRICMTPMASLSPGALGPCGLGAGKEETGGGQGVRFLTLPTVSAFQAPAGGFGPKALGAELRRLSRSRTLSASAAAPVKKEKRLGNCKAFPPECKHSGQHLFTGWS
jgi:hypothetical protein